MTDKQKEARRKSTKNWAATHPKEREAINKRYRERHKDILRQRVRDWRARLSPEARKAYYKRNYERYKARLAADPEYAARRKVAAKAATQRYIASHKKELAAKHKAYSQTHKAYLAKYKRERYHANPERERKNRRDHYYRNHAETLRKKREYRQRRLPETLMQERRAEANRTERKRTDAEYYAHCRATRRIAKAKKQVMAGKLYRPRFHTRIPDWFTLGQQTIDANSPWLTNNVTASQIAYGRELARDNRKRRQQCRRR